MSVIAAAVKYMLAAGMGADSIVAAVAEMEAAIQVAACAPKPRSTGAIRQERYRRNKASQPSHVTESDACDAPPPPPQAKASPQTPLENSTPPPRSVPSGPHCPPDGVGDGRARAPTIADADAVVAAVSAGLPEFHPLLIDPLAPSVALGWLRSGFDPQLDVLPAVARALEGEFAIKRWKGLTKWVENGHRDRLEAEQARAPPEIIPPPRTASRTSRTRRDPVSTVEIGRAIAANPPPGYS